MSDHTYAYPFDPSGSQSSNLIQDERHMVNPPDWRENYFIVPFVGPFFKQGLKVTHVSSGTELVDGVDYVLGFKFIDATKATGRELYGAICFLEETLNGVIEIDYQTLGGLWAIDEAKALELLSNTMNNPRISSWESVVERPIDFPVIDHEWDLVDMVGASEVVSELQAIVQAIYESVDGQEGPGSTHIQDRDNPHRVNKEQVELGNVENYPIASADQARAGESNTVYMTALRVSQAIQEQTGGDVSSHILNLNNPHEVNKDQVGLGEVQNYPIATASQARNASNQSTYMTPELVGVAINHIVGQHFTVHLEDMDNPHETTAEQIGLGNVQNYAAATVQEALDGASNRYVTPEVMLEVMGTIAGDEITSHVTNTNNPHQVTKDQLDLGNVENYNIANESQATNGESNTHYMTPLRVAQAIESSVGDMFQSHIDATDNPHEVTKNQVGLGEIENYPIADDEVMLNGESEEHYVTPHGVKIKVDAVVEPVSEALSDFQESLNNLNNYSTATVADIRDYVESVYTTGSSVGRYVDGQVDNLAEIIQGSFQDLSWTLAGNTPFAMNRQLRNLPDFLVEEYVTVEEDEEEEIEEETEWSYVVSLAGTPDLLFAGSNHGRLGHYDGDDWVEITPPDDGEVTRLYASDDGSYLYVLQDETLYQCSVSDIQSDSVSWTQLDVDIDLDDFVNVQCDGSNLAIATDERLIVSTNSGSSFTDLSEDVEDFQAISKWHNDRIYIAIEDVVHVWDGDLDEYESTSHDGSIIFIDVTADGDLLYFFEDGFVYRTSDDTFYAYDRVPQRSVHSPNDNLLIYITQNGIPFRSIDEGETFYSTHLAKNRSQFTHIGLSNAVWYGLDTQGRIYGG